MKPLLHQRIIANAGSGKTHRLTTRYLELLQREVPPERIVALTFTRKAAGEFLAAIFHRLVKSTEENRLIQLRQMVEKLPLLTLGTLDSFFGRIVRAFPFECGLAGELSVLDEHLQGVLRRQVLADLFREQGRDEEGFEEFLDLIRRQNRNREGRNVTAALDQEIQILHERFLLTPPDRPWGEPSVIWPEGCDLLHSENLPALVKEFESLVNSADLDDERRDFWAERVLEMRVLRPDSVVPSHLIKLALQALDPHAAKKNPGYFELKGPSRKTTGFPDSARADVAALGRAILQIELKSRMERSRALYDLLAHFDAPYQMQVRDGGRLTFLDITGLLAGEQWGGRSLRRFSRQEIDFRLDSSYDHWLLDEFQDTSRLQWLALRDLADEVIQSDTGRRSFFYVGDTKQAIYGWRGGDPRLFEEVADYYNASGVERIDTTETLNVSYRSVPEVLDTVNTIFSPTHLAQTKLELPAEAVERWRSAWCEHEPSEKIADRGCGCVAWRQMELPRKGRNPVIDEEAARLITEIDPLAHGWTCAVLVRRNARIPSLIDALRRAGLPATSEGRFQPCVDNDLGSALLSFLRCVAHPADTLSLGHVRMTPLKALLSESPDEFRLEAFEAIRAKGYHGAIAGWLARVDLPAAGFARSRADDFLEAAGKFDATWNGRSGIDDFVAFAESFASSENPATHAIRVLTIHAAKGLDFDMVVLPDLEGLVLPSRRSDATVHLHTNAAGQVEWGLDLPVQGLCEIDPVLSQAWEDDAAEDCYENLCLYYVALTRAKRGLYLLSGKLGAESKSRDFNRLLHETFPNGLQVGSPEWYRRAESAPPPFHSPPVQNELF